MLQGAVPVNVMVTLGRVAPSQTVPPPLMAAVGRGLTVTLPVIGSETQFVVVFLIVKVKPIELPEAPPLRATLIGLVKSPSVTEVIPVPEMEYLLGNCVGLVKGMVKDVAPVQMAGMLLNVSEGLTGSVSVAVAALVTQAP